MKTIDFSYFIERYNAGEMNDDEKQWFRKELEGNLQICHDERIQVPQLRRQFTADLVVFTQIFTSLVNKYNHYL